MPSLAEALERFRRALGARPAEESPLAGLPAVLDGSTAVAVTEACVAEMAATGATFPAAAAAGAWKLEELRAGTNLFDQRLASLESGSPRGALAGAIGLAMAGARVAVFQSGPDLASAHDLMVRAAGQHLPLVVHLAGRALGAHGAALGSGHEAYHGASDTGFFLLFARNVQEAVDLALIARRTAERALVPGLVAIDGDATADAIQDLRLPSPELVRTFLGDPGDCMECPTEAQRLLFGTTRRRVPRWFDLDRPALHGSLQGPEVWALGRAARHAYFDDQLPGILEESFSAYATLSGRRLAPIEGHRAGDARIVIVAQGAIAETAEAVADHLRAVSKSQVGVITLRCLRPFPAGSLAELLRGKEAVIVLERVPAGSQEPPLSRELRALLARGLEEIRAGGQDERAGRKERRGGGRERRARREKDLPRLHTALCGAGGRLPRPADLIAFAGEAARGGRRLVHLGIDFLPAATSYPKREVLLARLRREHPGAARLGLRSGEASPDLRPAGSVSIAIHRLGGDGHEELAARAAELLHRCAGGAVRGRLERQWERWDAPCADRITIGPPPLRDPGDDAPLDALLFAGSQARPLERLARDLARGGCLIIPSRDPDEAIWRMLPANVQATVHERSLALYALPAGGAPPPPSSPSAQDEALGLLAGVLIEKGLALRPRRLLAVREEQLADLPDGERAARLEVFGEALRAIRRVPAEAGEPEPPIAGEPEPPAAIRRLGRSDDTPDNLSRFWDQVGILYERDETSELVPDPYLAAGTVPPLSAAFRRVAGGLGVLPSFDPGACTGCGACWTICPDGAIGPVALGAGALLEAGMALAAARGHPVDALRRISSHLASRMHKEMRAEPAPATLRAAGQPAFDWVMEKRAPDPEARRPLEAAFAAVMECAGGLPVARTAPFLDEPERQNPGAGELLSILVNPDACKGCAACVAACEPGALVSQRRTPERVESARDLWRLWESLPDASGETLTRVAKHSQVGVAAAVMLSRHCRSTLAGADGAEAGSGEKTAMRLVLAAAEYHLQPRMRAQIEEIGALREELSRAIREMLSSALPADDLDALAAGLETLGRSDVDLAQLAAKIGAACETRHVDGARLSRLVEAAKALSDLEWLLERGPSRMGRSRTTLAVTEGPAWPGSFPHNPFAVPVVLDGSGQTADLARGLLEGQVRAFLEGVRAVRRARLELEKPVEAELAGATLRRLAWSDLTPEERRLCPPLLLAGTDAALGGEQLAQVSRLLMSDLPIKIVILSDLDGGLADVSSRRSPGEASAAAVTDLGLFALAHRAAYVCQSSIASADQLVRGVLEALRHPGPALLHIHAPKPLQHGFAFDRAREQARLGLVSRTHPLFRYDPAGEGVFGSRLDLTGNPDPSQVWIEENGAPFTTAHWAATERRFAAHFTPLRPDSPAQPLADAISPEGALRSGAPAFIAVTGEAGERRLGLSPIMLSRTAERLSAWRTLQELAGVVTPFTQRVREEAERELTAKHQAEQERLREEYEARLANLRLEVQDELAQRLRQRLMSLAGRGRKGDGADEVQGS